MDLRTALCEQYHGGLAMLAECIEKCPDALWLSGEHPRMFWRIAWHAAFFADNYMGQDLDAFLSAVPDWPAATRTKLRIETATDLTEIEPYDLPEDAEPIRQSELLEYITYLRGKVDATIADLDIETDNSGFPWYPTMSKLSHELMNLRHIQGHVGQLSELLMMQGIDTNWMARGKA